jgi:ketosteroid isomerase-like protein
MQDRIPGAPLTVMDDRGHMAPAERPEAVSQALSRWLSQPDPGPMTNTRSPAAISRIDRAIISWECERLIHLYAMLTDAGDVEAVASLFTRNALFAPTADPKAAVTGRDAILKALAKRPPMVTRHMISSVVITVQYPDRAIGHSYLTVHSARAADILPARAEPEHLIGAFQDRFATEEGAWKFAERRGSLVMRVGTEASA